MAEQRSCGSFETDEAFSALKACGGRNAWFCVGSLMGSNPSATCPGVGSFCYSVCTYLTHENADVCSTNCRLSANGPSKCTDWESQIAAQTLDTCARHRGYEWVCLQSFMVAGNGVAKCPGMYSRCFRNCAKSGPLNADLCEKICRVRTMGGGTVTYPPVAPSPAPQPPPQSDLQYCVTRTPVQCIGDPKCTLLGGGPTQGLGGPSYLCCANSATYAQCRQAAGQ